MAREDVEHVDEPGDKDVVRRLVEAAALATVDADPLAGQFRPGAWRVSRSARPDWIEPSFFRIGHVGVGKLKFLSTQGAW